MALNYKSGFCKDCGDQRKVARPRPNHVLHLLLSVLTVGFWIIVWVGTSIQFGGWRCDTCGSKKVSQVR